jgi:hypothetical protein
MYEVLKAFEIDDSLDDGGVDGRIIWNIRSSKFFIIIRL